MSLKNRFLDSKTEQDLPSSQETNLRRAAIIFLICKIYFTDDIGNVVKLRITNDEWNVFVEFINSVKHQPEYLNARIMFYYLFVEHFFKFTVKNKALALDYGIVEDEKGAQPDANADSTFWDSISKEIKAVERNEIAGLLELDKLRDEAMAPFEMLLPERPSLHEAFDEFKMLQEVVLRPSTEMPQKATRKQVSEACRKFLKNPGPGATYHVESQSEDIEMDSDTEAGIEKKKTKRTKRKKAGTSKEMKKQPESSSSESENERNFNRMVRSLGFNNQNVMRAIGTETFSEKLKRCYGKTE